MFAYCENNPIIRVDCGGNKWRDALSDVIHRGFQIYNIFHRFDSGYRFFVNSWGNCADAAGVVYLKYKGYDLAAWMYSYAFVNRDNGGNNCILEYDSLPPLLEDKLKASYSLHEALKYYINNSSSFDTGDVSVEFSKKDDPDLYYAIQHANYRAWGWQENGSWKINIFVWDTYNFDELRLLTKGFSPANAANDLVLFLQDTGSMRPYRWGIRYEYYY